MTEKEKTALNTLAPTSEGQPSNNNNIITPSLENCNTDYDLYRKMMRQTLDPSYLPTISMPELYENIYDSKPPVIEGLLYVGTYLFVGAPKVGKAWVGEKSVAEKSTSGNGDRRNKQQTN